MRRALSTCLCLLWLLAATAAGQTLAIQVPAESQPYTLVDAHATPGHNSYLWTVERPDREESSQWRQISPNCESITFTGPPGKYRITVIVTTGECRLLKASATTTIGGSGPDPTPVPPPGQLTAVVVYEATSGQIPSPLLREAMDKFLVYSQSQQMFCRVVDKDRISGATGTVPAWFAPYQAKAANQTGPLLILGSLGSDGFHSVVAVEPFTNYDRAVAFVKRYGGG